MRGRPGSAWLAWALAVFLHHGERFAPALLLVTSRRAARGTRSLKKSALRRAADAVRPYMELALYHPDWGYYEGWQVGCGGDFITSVSVGAAFGQLLRVDSLSGSAASAAVRLVEAGAHDETLAHDILTWLAENDEALLESLTYKIVEPSAGGGLGRRSVWLSLNGTSSGSIR